MRPRTLLILGAITVVGLGSLLLLRSYKLELIHTIVMNAMIQKVPDDFAHSRVRESFDITLQKSREGDLEDLYLDFLIRLGQILEKLQSLDADETEELLLNLRRLDIRGLDPEAFQSR